MPLDTGLIDRFSVSESTALVLLLVVLAANTGAIVLRSRLRTRRKW